MLRSLVIELNETVEAAVTETGVGTFLDTADFFATHELCGSAGAWIGAPNLDARSRHRMEVPDAAFRPTACGQRALAALVNEEVNGTTPSISC